MKLKTKSLTIFLLLSSFSFSNSTIFREQDDNRLIKVNQEDPPKWVTQEEINVLLANKAHFMDITDHKSPIHDVYLASQEFPETLYFQSFIKPTFENISIPRMTTFVNSLAKFTTRYHNSQSGVDASNWIASQATEAINNSNRTGVTVEKFANPWRQNSVIARIQGSDSGLKDEIIIFGAHMDSINSKNRFAAAPGSDDNAGGCVTVMETFRVLLASDFVPKRSLEFHFYSGEEVGLLGSGHVASAYYSKRAKVRAMVNFDVVGYNAGKNQIGLVTDHTDAKLTKFLNTVVQEYCSYTAFEHADIHTKRDTSDKMSFEQVGEFVKLAVATGIELGEKS
ncbi:Leucine aminopeptidase 1 [Folsomia candida]|uniref:Leucine aminopeptidase 1 n=1 Tax=Folsomia candida TaxID=158441 RepID=A0A226DFJ5_FOLCA|nr:Leucine aminopeptidase 1 [Folsomia candida]